MILRIVSSEQIKDPLKNIHSTLQKRGPKTIIQGILLGVQHVDNKRNFIQKN